MVHCAGPMSNDGWRVLREHEIIMDTVWVIRDCPQRMHPVYARPMWSWLSTYLGLSAVPMMAHVPAYRATFDKLSDLYRQCLDTVLTHNDPAQHFSRSAATTWLPLDSTDDSTDDVTGGDGTNDVIDDVTDGSGDVTQHGQVYITYAGRHARVPSFLLELVGAFLIGASVRLPQPRPAKSGAHMGPSAALLLQEGTVDGVYGRLVTPTLYEVCSPVADTLRTMVAHARQRQSIGTRMYSDTASLLEMQRMHHRRMKPDRVLPQALPLQHPDVVLGTVAGPSTGVAPHLRRTPASETPTSAYYSVPTVVRVVQESLLRKVCLRCSRSRDQISMCCT